MADITNLFKATVKALKSRNKSIGDNSADYLNKSILIKKQRSDFEQKAKNLVKSISKLKDFLLENRKDYVNSGSLLAHNGVRMSESERDQIDTDAQQIIKTCKETILVFRMEVDKERAHPQVKEHKTAVFSLIETYLKAICKIYSEQKAVRVKRVIDRKKISKLEPERKYSHMSRSQLKKDLNIDQGSAQQQDAKLSGNDVEETTKPRLFQLEDDSSNFQHEEDDITSEEAQMFEQENQALYEEMNSMAEEVRQIEGQVVEISKLQEIFTEKILEQDVQINTIANTVVGTTENIKDANEEIREAIKKKAEFRVRIGYQHILLGKSTYDRLASCLGDEVKNHLFRFMLQKPG